MNVWKSLRQWLPAVKFLRSIDWIDSSFSAIVTLVVNGMTRCSRTVPYQRCSFPSSSCCFSARPILLSRRLLLLNDVLAFRKTFLTCWYLLRRKHIGVRTITGPIKCISTRRTEIPSIEGDAKNATKVM